jgi:hypothetical protein
VKAFDVNDGRIVDCKVGCHGGSVWVW